MAKILYFTWICMLAQLFQVQCLIVEDLKCTDSLGPMILKGGTTLSSICTGLAVTITNDDGKIIPDLRNTSSLVMLRVEWSDSSPRVQRSRVEDTYSYMFSDIKLISMSNVTARVFNISRLKSSFDVPLGSLSTGLTVSDGCGNFYLRAALFIVSSTSPTLQKWISYKSKPVIVVCNETGFDVRLNVTWGATSKNASNQGIPTLIPGKSTLADAIPNLTIYLNHAEGDSVLPRTPLSRMLLWVYIRKMSHDMLSFGTTPFQSTPLRQGDIMLNNGILNMPGISSENSYELRYLYSLSLPKPYICGEAVIVLNLDPMRDLPDYDKSNNVAVIPVTVDCWGSPDLMGARIGMCTVIPDDMADGKRAWFYTAGIPYGYGEAKSYYYQAEDKTFKKLTVTDNTDANSAVSQLWSLQIKATSIDCPPDPLGAESITSTVDSLSQLVSNIRSKLLARSFENSEQIIEQQRLGTVLQAAAGVLTAGGVQGQGISQQFMDGMLNMLFNNMVLYPGVFSGSDPNVSYNMTRNGSRGDAEWAPYPVDSYHSMVAQTLSMLMSLPEWPLPFPNSQLGRAMPKFFNQLLWSSETLSKSTSRYTGLPADMVSALREVLVMILKQQLPRSLDPLGTLFPILNITLPDLVYGMPIETSAVQSIVDSIYTAVETVRNYQISITTASPTTTMTPTRPTNVTVTMASGSTPFVASTVPSTTTRLNTTFNGSTLPPFTAPSSPTTTPANNITRTVNATTPLVNMTTTRNPNVSTTNTNVNMVTTAANMTTRNPNVSTTNTNVSMVTTAANMTTRNPNVTSIPMGNNTAFPRLSTDLISRLSKVMNLRDPSLLNRFTVLSAFLNSMRDSETVSQLTSIIRQVQSSMALRDQWMLSEGMFAPVPQELLCRRQVVIDYWNQYYIDKNERVANLPTYWNTDESTSSIYRGDLSTITGRVYWTKVAVCSCESGNSGSYMAYDPMNPSQSSGDMGAKPPK